jgi:hypothetical protein
MVPLYAALMRSWNGLSRSTTYTSRFACKVIDMVRMVGIVGIVRDCGGVVGFD